MIKLHSCRLLLHIWSLFVIYWIVIYISICKWFIHEVQYLLWASESSPTILNQVWSEQRIRIQSCNIVSPKYSMLCTDMYNKRGSLTCIVYQTQFPLQLLHSPWNRFTDRCLKLHTSEGPSSHVTKIHILNLKRKKNLCLQCVSALLSRRAYGQRNAIYLIK